MNKCCITGKPCGSDSWVDCAGCDAKTLRDEALLAREEVARLRAALERCRDEFKAMRGPDSMIALCEEVLKR